MATTNSAAATVTMLVCFEYRVRGYGKRRGFAHDACVPTREDGTRQWDTVVVVPVADLADESCVLCDTPMVQHERSPREVSSADWFPGTVGTHFAGRRL